MSHRKDPNRIKVKNELIKRYGKRCWICGRKFNTNKKLQLHHILKWCEKHETNISNTSILCEKCHKNLHKYEKIDKKRYQEINNYLSQYKDSY